VRGDAEANVFAWTEDGTERLLGSLRTSSLPALWKQHQGHLSGQVAAALKPTKAAS
jgi:hypothetical protein